MSGRRILTAEDWRDRDPRDKTRRKDSLADPLVDYLSDPTSPGFPSVSIGLKASSRAKPFEGFSTHSARRNTASCKRDR